MVLSTDEINIHKGFYKFRGQKVFKINKYQPASKIISVFCFHISEENQENFRFEIFHYTELLEILLYIWYMCKYK